MYFILQQLFVVFR